MSLKRLFHPVLTAVRLNESNTVQGVQKTKGKPVKFKTITLRVQNANSELIHFFFLCLRYFLCFKDRTGSVNVRLGTFPNIIEDFADSSLNDSV